LGYLLFVKGLSGEASLIVEYDKAKIQLFNALPGIFFALFGGGILIAALRQSVSGSLQLGRGPVDRSPSPSENSGSASENEAASTILRSVAFLSSPLASSKTDKAMSEPQRESSLYFVACQSKLDDGLALFRQIFDQVNQRASRPDSETDAP
jgi:hypothetical protein